METRYRYAKDNREILQQANLRLEKLRVLLRLSDRMRYLDYKRYEFAMKGINEVGRILGGRLVKATRQMKRVRHLFEKIISFENLLRAVRQATSGKKEQIRIAHFLFYLENVRKTRLSTISGMVPALSDMPPGCRFQNRCLYADDICKKVQPEMIHVGHMHHVCCHRQAHAKC